MKRLWRVGLGGHDDSLLYLVWTDWRVTPKTCSDLLPRPALFPGRRDLVRFDSLRQAMERQRGPKPSCRVIRREIHAEFFEVHACQFRLTP